MAKPYHKIKAIKRTSTGLTFNADFFDSAGVSHWSEVWFELDASSAHTPAAALAIVGAKSDDEMIAAATLDADRVLAELEDPTKQAGAKGLVDVALPAVAIDAADPV